VDGGEKKKCPLSKRKGELESGERGRKAPFLENKWWPAKEKFSEERDVLTREGEKDFLSEEERRSREKKGLGELVM